MTSDPLPDAVIGEALDEVVVRAADDWVMLSEVDGCVSSAAARHDVALLPGVRIEAGLEVVRRVLEGGLMVAGDVADSGFTPWESTPAEAFERIAREWREAGTGLTMGDIGWLDTTRAGEAHADRARDAVNVRAGRHEAR
jgi:hypothetical protein